MIMPVPVKPAIDGEMLAEKAKSGGALQNASFASFIERLGKEGVRVFDPTELLMERKRALGGQPLYLQTDTHWRPETMEAVAQGLAKSAAGRLSGLSEAGSRPPPRSEVLDREGLRPRRYRHDAEAPEDATHFPSSDVTIHQVTLDTGLWHAEKTPPSSFSATAFPTSFRSMPWDGASPPASPNT
jgi:hypothetical protein